MVGKVNRSKARSIGEKVRLRLVPVYGVYRCHNCNWRGWMPRSSSSPAATRLFVSAYFVVAFLVIALVTYYLVTHWPTARYRY
jgi:hypothetical protein